MNNVKQETYVPFSQSIMRAGFTPIRYKEIYERLGCAEIEKLSDNATISDARQRIEEHNIGRKFFKWYLGNYCGRPAIRKLLSLIEAVSLKRCSVTIQNIDDYAIQEIPDNCLEKVNEAKALGLNVFMVAYPELGSIDPIIIGAKDYTAYRHFEYENNKISVFFIAQWGL